MLSRAKKESMVEGLRKDLGEARAVFLTNLVGIRSADAVEVRRGVREAGGKVVVMRNTLMAKAAEGTPAAALVSGLKGPHALALAFGDAPPVAKALKEAGKRFEEVEIRGGVLGDEELALEQVKALADLPSREAMLATLLASCMAPVSAFARLLAALRDECESKGAERPADLEGS